MEQPVIEKILTHLGLQARGPPLAPAREQAVLHASTNPLMGLRGRIRWRSTVTVDHKTAIKASSQAENSCPDVGNFILTSWKLRLQIAVEQLSARCA
jgi:hypothetical protein